MSKIWKSYHGHIGSVSLKNGTLLRVSRSDGMVVFESNRTGMHAVLISVGIDRARIHATGFADNNGATNEEAFQVEDLVTRAVGVQS